MWNFGPLDEVIITAGTSQDVVMMGFTFRLVEIVGDTAIVSSVSGTVIPELNSTMIVCRDGLSQPGEGERQEATVMVLSE